MMKTVDRSIQEWPLNGRVALRRLMFVSFEVALAITAIWTGGTAFLGLTIAASAFNAALPSAMVTVFNALYFASGVVMIFGIAFGYRSVEAVGLMLFITSLVVRVVALFGTFGPDPMLLSPIFLSSVYAACAIARLYVLIMNGKLLYTTRAVHIVESE